MGITFETRDVVIHEERTVPVSTCDVCGHKQDGVPKQRARELMADNEEVLDGWSNLLVDSKNNEGIWICEGCTKELLVYIEKTKSIKDGA